MGRLKGEVELLVCRMFFKKKKATGLDLFVIPKYFLVLVVLSILVLVGLLSFCFFYVYVYGCVGKLEILKTEPDPVEVIEQSLHLDDSILGKFGISHLMCTTCAKVLVYGLLKTPF